MVNVSPIPIIIISAIVIGVVIALVVFFVIKQRK
jgi:hypothetical protein